MLLAAADCTQGTGCHVITQLPWYFGAAVLVVWAAIVLSIIALLWRRGMRRRANPSRRTTRGGYELETGEDSDWSARP